MLLQWLLILDLLRQKIYNLDNLKLLYIAFEIPG